MKKNKIFAILTGTALISSALLGCNASQGETAGENTGSSQTSESSQSAGSLSVAFPAGNIRVTINILALQKGYFAEEGVDVTPVAIQGNDALTAINEENGTLDVLTVGFVPDVQAIGSGYDLKFVGGTAVEGGAIITKKGNAANYQDEDGNLDADAVISAKLGFVRNESSWVITRQYLLDSGVDSGVIDKLEDESGGSISYYSEETQTALAVQKGEIDLGFLPLEYAILYADSYDLEIVAKAGDLSPDYVCCREVTSSARLEEKYEAFVAYEKARIRAYDYYKQGETDDTIKADVVKTVADYSGKETDYVETYLYGGVTKFDVDPNSQGIKDYVEAAYNSGVFSQSSVDFGSYDIGQNIDTSAYKEALDALVSEYPDNETYQALLKKYSSLN